MQNLLIIGAGKSGIAAAKLAVLKNFNVIITDPKSTNELNLPLTELNILGIKTILGVIPHNILNEIDLVVTSPGVPPNADLIKQAELLNIEIISELEFAYQFCSNPIIAVTGTNGKTTTTALIQFMLNHAGRKAVACGNIGLPLSDVVRNNDNESILVVEVSSYQLSRIKHFCPNVAVILNITPDHLNYHGTLDAYVESKWKITLNQNEKNLLILNRDDELLMQKFLKTHAETAFISMQSVDRGIYTSDGKLILKYADKEEVIMSVADLGLPGIHNTYNSMAAALAVRAFELSNEDIRDSLSKFNGVEHRLEFVRTIYGIDFINDSKATNINATWYALQAYSSPIIWIAGGRGDNNDYSALDDIVQKNVKIIIALGEEADNIFNHFCLKKRCIKVNSLDEAVKLSLASAESGDKVIFTPACKSFDMFVNFEHRGEIFKNLVNAL